eukprot:1222527-Pleurochrysis_carterae.AAC.2
MAAVAAFTATNTAGSDAADCSTASATKKALSALYTRHNHKQDGANTAKTITVIFNRHRRYY